MDVNKIHVRVDKKHYTGLYWLSEAKGKKYINVYYEGLRKISAFREGDIDQLAKKILSDLIDSI
jgi:hypothetical protein